MNYSITTSSYFDVAAKRLAKKYPSFKEDASSAKVNVLKEIIKEEGFPLQ